MNYHQGVFLNRHQLPDKTAGEKSLQISQFCRIPNSGFEMHTRFKLILELLEPRHVEFTQLVLWQPNRHLWLTRDTLNSPYHGASLTHAEFRIPTAAYLLIYFAARLLLQDSVEQRPVVDKISPPPFSDSCNERELSSSIVTGNDLARRCRIQWRQNSTD
ncbi:hypothetical protein T4C_165 [Trichinella pseudospiralis]|uniref:Uncharacterized protein n=1 Tax=Trichinella pseudospiralis TaxID=6337 RepID=A0A0V1KA63_TRIPS|nr:hypothetical protein T4C_165 [Trichinella pseudospiralis]